MFTQENGSARKETPAEISDSENRLPAVTVTADNSTATADLLEKIDSVRNQLQDVIRGKSGRDRLGSDLHACRRLGVA